MSISSTSNRCNSYNIYFIHLTIFKKKHNNHISARACMHTSEWPQMKQNNFPTFLVQIIIFPVNFSPPIKKELVQTRAR